MRVKLLMVLLVAFIVSCSDDNNGNGDGAPGYSHNELAEKFVKELNLDPEFNVSLSKRSTLRKNFIVIYDPYTRSFDAINIDNYDPAVDNATDYYNNNSERNYFNLEELPGYYQYNYRYVYQGVDYEGRAIYDWEYVPEWVPTRYRDPVSNIYFEKVKATPKDLAKVAALTEIAVLKKKSEFLAANYGLSLERSKEIARLTGYWKKATVKGMTDKERDRFSSELLGFSISEGVEVMSSSAGTGLSELIDRAAAQNEITPEHAAKLMQKVFGLE